MIDLSRLFTNWFSNKNFTPTRKLSFADDTRSRIASNNGGGEFDVLLPLLDAAIVSAGGTTGSENVAKAVRRAAVIGKRNLLEQIKDTISSRAGRIADSYGKESEIYAAFFPAGVTAYRQMTESEVGPMLDVIIAAGNEYEPDIGIEFTALKADWTAVKDAADDRIAAVSTADGNQDAAIDALDLILMRVIFTAALAFVGNPAMGPILFDQSKLYAPGQSPEPDPEPRASCGVLSGSGGKVGVSSQPAVLLSEGKALGRRA